MEICKKSCSAKHQVACTRLVCHTGCLLELESLKCIRWTRLWNKITSSPAVSVFALLGPYKIILTKDSEIQGWHSDVQQERLCSQQVVIWIDSTSLLRSQLTLQQTRRACNLHAFKYELCLAKIIFSINGSKYTKALGMMMHKVHQSHICLMCMQQLFSAANSPNLFCSYQNWGQ